MSTALPQPWLIRGFLFAAAYNIVGMLVFSKGFTNPVLEQQDPALFSWMGQVGIVLWGLAYGSVARSYIQVPYLLLVFFCEKMVYVVAWLLWLNQHGANLPELFASSPLSGLFFAAYGAGDLLFGLMFLWAFKQARAAA